MSRYQCPECGCQHCRVYYTEAAVKMIHGHFVSAVRRKRECRYCGHRWSTVEIEESDNMTWVPKTHDGPDLSGPYGKNSNFFD